MNQHDDTPKSDTSAEPGQPVGDAVEQQQVEEPAVVVDPVDESEADEPFTPDSQAQKFQVTKPIGEPVTGEEPKLADCIAILRETQDIVKQVFEHHDVMIRRLFEREEALLKDLGRTRDVVEETVGNPHLRLLFGALSRQIGNEEDLHKAALYREGANWVQTIEHDGKTIGGGIPVQRLANGKYTREELMSYVTRKAGVGAPVDIPLWHSGIWLRFRAPSLIELTTMNQEIANIKVSVGAETRGLAFSNVAHFIKNIVVDFALQHVTQANVNFNTPSDLKELIDVRDIPGLFLGMAATLYPNGYPYASACIADLATCNHITKEIMKPVTFWWVDDISLTAWQRSHMAQRINERSPRTLDDIKNYKAQHTRGGERLIKLGPLGFLLSCPSVFEHEELGRAWLNGIIEMTQGAFNEPPEGKNRSAFIQQLAESTSAREYAHWVKAIVELDPDTPEGYRVLSEEKDFIADVLSSVYSADEHIDQFTKEVERYIDDSLIALSAITTYNCPKCNTPQAEKFKERFENLIPIDPLNEFFTLGIRKLSRIM